MTREEINLVGTVMGKIRDAEVSCVIVSLGACGPSADCRGGSMVATVTMGADTCTGEAVYLADAIALAKGACQMAADRRRRKKETAGSIGNTDV